MDGRHGASLARRLSRPLVKMRLPSPAPRKVRRRGSMPSRESTGFRYAPAIAMQWNTARQEQERSRQTGNLPAHRQSAKRLERLIVCK